MPTILIIDDSSVMRKLLREALAARDIWQVQAASSGKAGLSLLTNVRPDLIVLDIEMPEMDGLETLRRIREVNTSVPVLMFSSLTRHGAAATIDSLMLGATDYATKPSNSGGVDGAIAAIRGQLVPKVQALLDRSASTHLTALSPVGNESPWIAAPPQADSPRAIEIVAIGSSTGGPNALAEVLPRLQNVLPVPVVVVQHMPPIFTGFLAKRLDASSALEVHEAHGGEALAPGHVWIAPGDRHMIVRREGPSVYLEIQDGPEENSCRPSVDVLFRSVAEAYPGSALSVVLTGMGQDGFRGARALAASGSVVLAQDEASSVVWGMPGYIAKAGIADKVLPLGEIASEITARVSRRQLRVGQEGNRINLDERH
jgi:two-component system chemotaxis response regulator CheB